MTLSIGIDVGSGVIKTALFRVEGGNPEWVARWDARIRQRVAFQLVSESVEHVLGKAGLKRDDVDYVATTGEGESYGDATGHFYSMTTHARGALYLDPEARADILAGLHRAIMLRAMSIISRSGGVTNEFTFTGGVAKNEAAVKELRQLVRENYGEVTINISPESIYTGALGGAAFALRAVLQ